MRFLIFFLSVLSLLSVGAYAESRHFLTKDQLFTTEAGFFFILNEIPVPTTTITYMGNGVYAAEYYGQCGRCGWALDQTGKCTNQNCNQYGPRERD